MNSYCMTRLCELKPLVQTLTTLKVLPRSNNTFRTPPNLRLVEAISSLVKNNSSLSFLLISHHPHSPAATIEVAAALLQQFQKLPIQRLTLSEHIFLPGATLKTLVKVLPAVETLSLASGGKVPLKQLNTFASCAELPDLRVLDINIDFESVRKLDKAEFGASQNQSFAPMKLQSDFTQVGMDRRLARPVARFLHALWPGVVCSPTPRLEMGFVFDSEEGVRLINAWLVA
ncbi:hypothetical protein BDV93DRAFT_525187, partial [Ceratobasidium sp. AG-I]